MNLASSCRPLPVLCCVRAVVVSRVPLTVTLDMVQYMETLAFMYGCFLDPLLPSPSRPSLVSQRRCPGRSVSCLVVGRLPPSCRGTSVMLVGCAGLYVLVMGRPAEAAPLWSATGLPHVCPRGWCLLLPVGAFGGLGWLGRSLGSYCRSLKSSVACASSCACSVLVDVPLEVGGRARGAGRLCPEVLRVRLMPGLAAGCSVGSATAAVVGGFVHVHAVDTEDYCHEVGLSRRCPWGRLHSLVTPLCAGGSLSLVFCRACSHLNILELQLSTSWCTHLFNVEGPPRGVVAPLTVAVDDEFSLVQPRL